MYKKLKCLFGFHKTHEDKIIRGDIKVYTLLNRCPHCNKEVNKGLHEEYWLGDYKFEFAD